MTNQHAGSLAFVAVLLALSACGDDSGVEHNAADAGRDAGNPDASKPNGEGGAGASRPDAALADAARPDAARPDAGSAQDGGGGGGGRGRGSEDEDAGTEPPLREVTIRFGAKVGTLDFACGQTYPGVGATATTIEPRELRFYVQDLRLITATGDEVPVQLDERDPWQSENLALLDFADASAGCASYATAETNAEVKGRVPAGDYTGVAFANGVPEELNHGDVTLGPAPLQVSGMAWTWLLGYRFIKLEVAEVVTPPALPGTGILHVGSGGCSGAPVSGFTCTHANRTQVRLDDFDPDSSVIVLDVAKVLADVDLGAMSQCHGDGAVCEATFPVLGIDFDTGDPLDTQTAYRVE